MDMRRNIFIRVFRHFFDDKCGLPDSLDQNSKAINTLFPQIHYQQFTLTPLVTIYMRLFPTVWRRDSADIAEINMYPEIVFNIMQHTYPVALRHRRETRNSKIIQLL